MTAPAKTRIGCGFCGQPGHAYTSCAVYAAMRAEIAHGDAPDGVTRCATCGTDEATLRQGQCGECA